MWVERLKRVFSQCLLVALFAVSTWFAADAQTTQSGIFTLNQDRLYNQSKFGLRVKREAGQRTSDIAAENRRMEAKLKAEELDLTKKRPSLKPAEFRKLADEFDAKVEKIRSGQAQKTVDFNSWAAGQRKQFFDSAFPILLKLADQLKAVAILDRRSVIISSDETDITDRAIKKIDAAIGDGTPAPDQ